MNIGNRIKDKRKEKKITQKELSTIIDKSERMVQKYENNEVEPSIQMLNKIANALGVSINDLIKDTNIVSLTEGGKELKEMYSEALALDSDFPVILEKIESSGYTLLQNTNNWDVSIVKDKSVVATIPEKEFIEHGKRMLTNIKRYTEFEVYKIIDDFYFLYSEE